MARKKKSPADIAADNSTRPTMQQGISNFTSPTSEPGVEASGELQRHPWAHAMASPTESSRALSARRPVQASVRISDLQQHLTDEAMAESMRSAGEYADGLTDRYANVRSGQDTNRERLARKRAAHATGLSAVDFPSQAAADHVADLFGLDR